MLELAGGFAPNKEGLNFRTPTRKPITEIVLATSTMGAVGTCELPLPRAGCAAAGITWLRDSQAPKTALLKAPQAELRGSGTNLVEEIPPYR